jgi:hypothetical protein
MTALDIGVGNVKPAFVRSMLGDPRQRINMTRFVHGKSAPDLRSTSHPTNTSSADVLFRRSNFIFS